MVKTHFFSTLLELSKECQKGYSDVEQKRLLKRRLMELVELLKEKDRREASGEETQGRQTGSLSWRLARGEAGSAEAVTKTVWRLTEEEKESKSFHLEYSVVQDKYFRY